jgi:serine/threonine-protein kinase
MPIRGGSARWQSAGVGAVIALLFVSAALLVWKPWREDQTTSPAVTTTTTTTTPDAQSVTFERLRDFVTDYYGVLPANAAQAWTKLDPAYQGTTGQGDYLSFWSGLRSVTVLSVSPRDASSVVVRLRYTRPDGTSDTENRSVTVVSRNGQLLISDSQRIGGG